MDYLPPARTAAPRRSGPSPLLVTLLVLALVLGGLLVTGAGASAVRHVAGPHVAAGRLVDAGGVTRALPPVPADARRVRLLPQGDPGVSGPHAFARTLPDGRPVAYDPCRPIHYVVNDTRTPYHGRMLLDDALRAVSQATGLQLVDDGTTDERPSEDRAVLQPERYGDRWAPVLIAWADEADYPPLAGPVAGIGGSAAVSPRGPASARLVSGQLVLDRGTFDTMVTTGHYAEARAIALHELGHVVGLDHTADPTQLMAPSLSPVTWFAAGDLEGLAAVGRGSCHDDT